MLPSRTWSATPISSSSARWSVSKRFAGSIGPEPEYSRIIRSVAVDWISNRIEKIVEEQRRPWLRAWVTDTSGASDPWLLEITGDRRAQLVVQCPTGERLSTFVAGWDTVARIRSCLSRMQRRPIPEWIEQGGSPLGTRFLEVSSAGSTWKLRIGDVWGARPNDRKEVDWGSDAVEAWAGFRSLIDEKCCADHRPDDQRWLARRR